jgi:hypothetical protein
MIFFEKSPSELVNLIFVSSLTKHTSVIRADLYHKGKLQTNPNPHAPPEQKLVKANAKKDPEKNNTNSKMDFNSFTTHIGQFNSKTFAMPNNSQFALKWQSFQNALPQLTPDWIEILLDCTKTDGVCV